MAPANRKSGHFSEPAKSGSGKIYSRICWICQVPLQLQYVQLITDKTNAADLSSDVFTILISVTRMKNTQFIDVLQISLT